MRHRAGTAPARRTRAGTNGTTLSMIDDEEATRMTNRTRTFGAALALAFVVALAPVDAQAQGMMDDGISALSVDARGGIAVPFGDLGDLADVGPTVGIGVAYRVSPRLSVRADGDLDLYSGADFGAASAAQPSAPDMTLWHYSGGLQYDVTEPGTERWNVAVNVGVGATIIDTDPFVDGPVENPETDEIEADFNETYFTANGGVRFGYAVHERVDVYGGAQWYVTFADEEDTAVFSALSPTEVNAFDRAHSVPLTLGVKLKF